jgi:hypothetical protein
MTKRMIEVTEVHYSDMFCGRLSEVIEYLTELENKDPHATLLDRYDSEYGSVVFELKYKREETDEECQKRLKEEKKNKKRAEKQKVYRAVLKAKQEAARRKQYEALKKEFG